MNARISKSDLTYYKGPVVIDTGADINLLPLSVIPAKMRKGLAPCAMTVNGISGKPMTALGQIHCRINFEMSWGPAWVDTTFQVFDIPGPVLVGEPTLEHKSVSSYTVTNGSITFHWRFQNRSIDQCIPRIGRPQNAFQIAKAAKPTHGTLDEKVQWLKDHTEIQVPADRNGQELESVVNLLLEFADIFGHENCVQGLFPDEVRIKTLPDKVMNQRQHPIAHHFQTKLEEEISSMLENGVIENCPNPKGWNSPLVTVGKKTGKLRVCANFKNTLNRVLAPESDVFQMPSTDTIFHEIGNENTYFSSLDLKSGYWHLAIDSRDRHKTAFQYKDRTYQFKRVPFGLKNAGDLFNRAVSKAMEGVARRSNYKSYVDDVMVYANTFTAYIETLEQIFIACRKYNMRLSGSKCTFLQESAKFLGRIVDNSGYAPDPDYVEAILEMEAPKTKRQLSACIGRFNWLRDYISPGIGESVAEECFSHILSEMTCLNRKDKKFKWTSEATTALEKCKEVLSSPKVIAYADFTKPFCLVTDASDTAMGAVLLQKHGNHQRIVATGSKTFDSTQRNWSATEREGFAIVFFVERFAYFLRGKPFILMTDHKALTAIDRKIIANPKMARWQDRLGEFDFVVQYIPGRENVIADMFSRPYAKRVKPAEVTTEIAGRFYTFGENEQQIHVYVPSWISATIPEKYLLDSSDVDTSQVLMTCTKNIDTNTACAKLHDMADEQSKEPLIARLMGYLKGNIPVEKWKFDKHDDREKAFHYRRNSFFLHEASGALMIRYNQREFFVLSLNQVRQYLRMAHDDHGHFGADRVIENMYNLWWPGKMDDIKNYCASCIPCLRRKGSYMQPNKLPSGHIQQGTRPFQHITIDFISMPISQRGKKYCLTILCNFSRYLEVIPTTRNRAIDAVNGIRDWILRHGAPETIGSDRGVHFANDLFSQMCASLRIHQKLHVAYRPQSSGNVERAHRTLKNSLWTMKQARDLDWEECVPYVVRAMNCSVNAATKMSPVEAVYGRKPDLTGTQLDSPTTTSPAEYGRRIAERLGVAHRAVTVAQKGANEELDKKSKPQFEALELQPGDKIYLRREQSVDSAEGKLPFIGPFEVIASHDFTVQIDKGNDDVDFVHRSHCVKEIPRNPHLEDQSDESKVRPEAGLMSKNGHKKDIRGPAGRRPSKPSDPRPSESFSTKMSTRQSRRIRKMDPVATESEIFSLRSRPKSSRKQERTRR